MDLVELMEEWRFAWHCSPHRERMSMPLREHFEQQLQMQAWCIENLGLRHHISSDAYATQFEFLGPAEHVLFMLRWSEEVKAMQKDSATDIYGAAIRSMLMATCVWNNAMLSWARLCVSRF